MTTLADPHRDTEPTADAPDGVTDLSPELAAAWLDAGDTVLVDVREDFEHAEERIDGAVSAPLSRFDPRGLRERTGSSRVVFHCRSGKRSLDAANRFRERGETAYHLAGGIEAWKAAGRPTIRPIGAPRLPVMRQVQLIAGALVALGTLLGAFVDPWFLVVPGFVGCGLAFAGLSGWCGMALLLAKMPWNRGLRGGASCGI